MTDNKLTKTLEEITKGYWEKNKQPVFLSALPPLLMEKLPNYKEYLQDSSLKKFIQKTEGTYKLIQDSDQAAKIAILPKDESYQFPEVDAENKQSEATSSNTEKELIEFLRTLKKLPEKYQEKIEIPISVLLKMIK